MGRNRVLRGSLAFLLVGLVLLTVYGPALAADPPEGTRHSFLGSTGAATTDEDVLALVVADLDNDTYADLAYGDGSTVLAAQNSRDAATSWPVVVEVGTTTNAVAAIALADFDRDGWHDLVAVTADASGGNEVTLWQNPTAPFTDTWTVSHTIADSLSYGLTAVAAVDLDRNGTIDVVAAGDNGVIYLWSNPGSSPFATGWGTPATVTVGSDPLGALAVADLDGDGLLDLVTGHADAVVAWRNPGTPFVTSWTVSNTLGTLDDDVTSIALGDLDHDARPDVVAADAAGSIVTWRNPLAAGLPFTTAWGSATDVRLPGTPAGAARALVLTDLDHDGDLDLAGAVGDTVMTWQNAGEPFSGEWVALSVGGGADTIYSVAVADVDRDGDFDVVSGSGVAATHEIVLWWNTLMHRRMAFQSTQSAYVAGTRTCRFVDVVSVDLDGDGDLDLATACNEPGGVGLRLWENDGSPFDGGWSSYGVPSSGTITSIAVADFDRDGRPDLVTGHEDAPRLVVWRNAGTPFSGGWVSNTVGAPPVAVGGVATGDFDRDGFIDIVAVTGGTDQSPRTAQYTISVWRNDGTPFDNAWSYNTVYVPYYAGQAVAVGDLDNDGWLDLVVGLSQAVAVGTLQDPAEPESWLDNYYQLRAYRNDGAPFGGPWVQAFVGRDAKAVTLAPGSGRYHGFWGATVYDVAIADLDGDGVPDIASVDHIDADYQIKVWRNDGTPFDDQPEDDAECRERPYIWQPTAVYAGTPAIPWLDSSAYGVAIADMNLDGLLDLVTVNGEYDEHETNVWVNDGRPFGASVADSTWARSPLGQDTTDRGALSVAVGDLDNDGDPDIIHGSGNYYLAGVDNDLLLWKNPSGTIAFDVASTTPASFLQGSTDDILRLSVVHRGFTVDHNATIAGLHLRFETELGVPLTTVEAQALIQNLYVYHSDDVTFTTADTQLAAVTQAALSLTPEGMVSISLPESNPLLQMAPLAVRHLFVVIEATSDAASQSPNRIVAVLDPDVDVTVKDSTTDAVVSNRSTDATETNPIAFVGPATRVVVADAPTADGNEVITATLGTGQQLMVYANSYDALGNFRENVAVTWSLVDILGQVVGGDFVPAANNRSATFTGHRIGAARILADHPTLTDDMTGSITVTLELTVAPNPAQVGPTAGAIVTATLVDTGLDPVANGTAVTFATNIGGFTGLSEVVRTTTGGVATADLTSDLRGTGTVTVTINGVQGSQQVQFVSGIPHTLDLIVVPDSLPADGVTTAVITATVTDFVGDPVADGTVVTFETTLGSLPGSPSTATTDDGVATITLTAPTTTGTATVTATAGAATDDVEVTFVPGAPDTLELTAAPTSLVANGTATAQLTATVSDEYDNPVADGTVVTFTTTLGSLPGSPSTATTEDGVATITLTAPTTTGTATVTATAGAATDDVEVTFVPGAPATLELVAVPTSLVANGTATSQLTATVRDAHGNLVADGTVVTFETALGSLPGSPSTATTEDGVASITLTAPTTTGTATVTATAGAATDTAQVTFVPGAPDTLELTAVPTSLVANGTATAQLTATVRDALGNLVADGTVVTFETTLGSLPGSPSTATTDDGVATITLTAPTTTGTATVTATAGAATDDVEVTFVPGAPATLELVAVPDILPPDGTSTSQLTATVRDAFGNLVADGTVVTFATTLGSLPGSPSTATTEDGVATITLTAPTTTGTATVTATAGAATDDVEVTFVPGAPVTLTLTAVPTSLVANGTATAQLTATVRDTLGNLVADGTIVTFETTLGSLPGSPSTATTEDGVATITLTAPTTTGTATVTATAGAGTDSVQVTFVPGAPATLALGAVPTSLVANGTATSQLTATVRDAFGNLVADGTVVTFETTLGSLPGSPSTATTEDGVATITLTAPTTTGTATVTATAGAATDNVQVTFVPGAPATLELVAVPTSLVANGTATSQLTATVRDAFGNLVADGTVVTFATTLGSLPGSPSTATTEDGVATITLTAPTTTGTATVTATAGAATDSVQVTFMPGAPATLALVAVPTSLVADGSATSQLTATVRDAFGNLVADGTVVTFATTLGSLPGSPSTATTEDGVATITLTAPTTTGTATVTATAGAATDNVQVTFFAAEHIIYMPLVFQAQPPSGYGR